ncbi:MAG: class I adenylate-forming enzyme family protein [Arenibacterium sp.]
MIEITAAPPQTPMPGTVVDMIRASARRNPDREALVCGSERLSWAAFDVRVNRVANALIARGVAKGDNIAVLSRNSIPYAELFIGILRAGACITPLSTMASSEALGKMVADCGAKILFLSDSYRELAEPFLPSFSGLKVAIDFSASDFADYEAMLAQADDSDPMVPVTLSDPVNLIYSSGTTGTPKGILHPHAMRAAQMERVAPNGYDDAARTLISTPLYSNTTIVSFLPTLVGGSTVILMPKFDAKEWLKLAEAEKVTHTMLVPVQYKRILDVPEFDDFDLSHMRVKFSTSAPLRADVKADALRRFPGKLMEFYGLTEGGAVCVLPAHDHPDKLHTVGRPGPNCDIRLIDPQGKEVPQGEIGEICGRSPTMMLGYFGREDLTREYLWHDEAGRVYFRSGDMGRLDEDGFLILSDRKKDMIISGGLNVYANDLELELLKDPDVTDAAVIGIPSEEWGETPLGLVVLRGGAARSAQEIRDTANQNLGKSHRLARVEIREELPRSSIGKILKKELRAPYWEPAGK